jgi:hypothetical protein
MAQDTQIFCGCNPSGLCLTIIRVPVGAFELAGNDDMRLVADEHVDRLPGRVVSREAGYAAIEWSGEPIRPPQPHTRRAVG